MPSNFEVKFVLQFFKLKELLLGQYCNLDLSNLDSIEISIFNPRLNKKIDSSKLDSIKNSTALIIT